MSTAEARRAFDKALREYGDALLTGSMNFLNTPTQEVSVTGQVDMNLALQRLLAVTVDLCAAMHNDEVRAAGSPNTRGRA